MAEIDAWLRAQGFFEGDAEGLVADVYLGYALSDSLRRTGTPAPPEPCPLPRAAVAVRPRTSRLCARAARSAIGAWERTWTDRSTRQRSTPFGPRSRRGDVYQVNLVQHLSAPVRGRSGGSRAALAPLRPLEPRPLVGDGWAIVSASPELFLARRGRRVWTMPIKGTRPLGGRRPRRTPRRTRPST